MELKCQLNFEYEYEYEYERQNKCDIDETILKRFELVCCADDVWNANKIQDWKTADYKADVFFFFSQSFF